ncbi:tRNA (adenosine(37)-N6)-dimethylallyltransferase MiaA [Desulfovibrio sp.]|uniref:tRNA (adenosine(37)-N6)-dimethylallyltransferase MiaA n=1 Tax=Desulfovibrio sp. TaxID=885 RepID=UPI0023D3CF7F|nr:tRNA (adenosine(37)-N6)-dimethylallyltransferase MiaA [Desulfovibrio sp.]MDE7241324.1 tRNA (adenosine(37)-N6)-dimethylallyltransferase MiaA [Desulfovibrio sp.]
MPRPIPVICLAGPTGSGKTALALHLARELGGEIINADSRQVYADFPLITAQPSPDERARAPHHLYGFLPTAEKISAGRWADMAAAKAREVTGHGRVPLLVGGTGLYFQALLRGMAAIPAIAPEVSAGLEARLREAGPEALHAELSRQDPAYAARIHPRDRQRILRALEVLEGTGKTFSWWHGNAMSAPLCAGPLFVLDAPLAWLAPRLGRRLDAMLEAGAVEEARRALARSPDAAEGARPPGWSGIGCAELLDHLRGRTSLAECRARWLANTRAYAKRQLTWFRARSEAVFLPPEGGEAELLRAARGFLEGRKDA